MKDETLLPCPFCGGKAEFDYDDDGINWISCSTCGVSTDTAYHTDVDARETLRDVWNRRALQSGNSAQPVTVPDGYVLVPVEPTEDMVINGFESEPDEHFSDSSAWEAYNAMSGCQQAAHRATLCWAAMIAAAPKGV